MEEIVGMLSEDIEYVSHEIQGGSIQINVQSRRQAMECPYCGHASDRVHSFYNRRLQDLPIQGKKVNLLIKRKKYFCMNEECDKGTFAEQFDFFDEKGSCLNRKIQMPFPYGLIKQLHLASPDWMHSPMG